MAKPPARISALGVDAQEIGHCALEPARDGVQRREPRVARAACRKRVLDHHDLLGEQIAGVDPETPVAIAVVRPPHGEQRRAAGLHRLGHPAPLLGLGGDEPPRADIGRQ